MSHWIIDEATGEYYQPEHDETGGGRGTSPIKQIAYFGGSAGWEKFMKKGFKAFKFGGVLTPEQEEYYHGLLHAH